MKPAPASYAEGIGSQRPSSDIPRAASSGQPPRSSKEGSRSGAGRPGTVARRWYFPNDARACLNGILRLLVGGAFVVAGALKIADPAKFALDVSNYRLVPHELINLVAILVPWIEITAGSFVLAGIWLRAAALVITSLTVVFFAIIVSALARGLNIECGCFGTIGGKHIGLVNLAIDATLLCLAAALARRSKPCRANEILRPAGPRNIWPTGESSTPGDRRASQRTSGPCEAACRQARA